MTHVVNLFAGPGAGKSTTAALTFGLLKRAGVNAELVGEYAKDLVWEERHAAFGFQPYIIAKQMWRTQRLIGKVDVIITDSPILLGLVYGAHESFHWRAHVKEVHDSWRPENYYLHRGKRQYLAKGRGQSEDEARGLDTTVRHMLELNRVPYLVLPSGPEDKPEEDIFDDVMMVLND